MSAAPEASETIVQVLVLSDSGETASQLTALLASEEGIQVHASKQAFGEGSKAIARYEPHVVVVADTFDAPAAVVEMLDSASPGMPVLALLPEGDVHSAQACSLAGARATLLRPFDDPSLAGAIRHIHTKEVRRKQHMTASLDSGDARPQRPRIIAVHGAKGGVGTTMLACNLAVALRQLTGRRVALVDADVLGGDAGVLFDLAPSRSVADVLPVLRDLEADLVGKLLTEHATGVRVLFAPEQFQRAEALDGDDIQRVLSGLKPYFDYQVVDTSSLITPVTLATLDEADAIVHVVTPEVPALRNAARFLQLASQLGYPEEKIILVANRANAGKGINSVIIEEQLQRPLAAAFPSDGRTLVECANTGELLIVAHPRHKVARSIHHFAEEIAMSFGWKPAQQNGRVAATSSQIERESASSDKGQSSRKRWSFPFPGHRAMRPLPVFMTVQSK